MRLDRLRRLTRQELHWRATTLARAQAHRLAAALRAPRWERRRLARVSTRGALDAGGREALDGGQWNVVHRALAARMTARHATFVLDPANTSRLREVILAAWPHAADDARERAA